MSVKDWENYLQRELRVSWELWLQVWERLLSASRLVRSCHSWEIAVISLQAAVGVEGLKKIDERRLPPCKASWEQGTVDRKLPQGVVRNLQLAAILKVCYFSLSECGDGSIVVQLKYSFFFHLWKACIRWNRYRWKKNLRYQICEGYAVLYGYLKSFYSFYIEMVVFSL